MDFKALWSKFRGTPYFRIAYLLLIAIASALILVTPFACFAILLVPVLTLLVPHWFGERRVKHHALNGVFMLAAVPLLAALLITPAWIGQDEFVQELAGTSGVSLSHGIVRPFRTGPVAGDFNFTVTMWTNQSAVASLDVRVHVLSLAGLSVTNVTVGMTHVAPDASDVFANGNYGDGERFWAIVPLAAVPHSFNFHVRNTTSSGIVVETLGAPGPFNAQYGAYFQLWFVNRFFNTLFIIVGFYLLLLLYWWTRKAREMRGEKLERGRKRDEGGGEYTCTNCGGDVSEADAKCPNCGAEFGPGPSSEPAERTS
jgi:hypothetical protein